MAAESHLSGTLKGLVFEERMWNDPELGDTFVLRRFWTREKLNSPKWQATYHLRAHYADNGYDPEDPDMMYVLRPDLPLSDRRSLRLAEDDMIIDRKKWSRDNGEDDPSHLFECVYVHLLTSYDAHETQLLPNRSHLSGELMSTADYNQEFNKIILGESVVAGLVHVKEARTRGEYDVFDESKKLPNM